MGRVKKSVLRRREITRRVCPVLRASPRMPVAGFLDDSPWSNSSLLSLGKRILVAADLIEVKHLCQQLWSYKLAPTI